MPDTALVVLSSPGAGGYVTSPLMPIRCVSGTTHMFDLNNGVDGPKISLSVQHVSL